MYDKELKVCKELVRRVGKEILKIYSQDFSVYTKADESPITLADVKAHHMIKDTLNEFFDYYIISEESLKTHQCCTSDCCWIIDPIDGTKEFVKKNGEFTINIALLKKDALVFSIIYAPVLDEMYYAIKNVGAFFEKDSVQEQIHVSNRQRNLHVLISQSHQRPRNKALLEKNKEKIKKITPLGSSLKGCRIAKGEQDVYYRFGPTCIWDTAAMELIVKEAGGHLLKLNGESIDYRKCDVINPAFFIINDLSNQFDE